MKFYTGNYTRSNHNFVISNFNNTNENNTIVYDLIFNFLQRGVPTNTSQKIYNFLEKNNFKHNPDKSNLFISKTINHWNSIIKGDDKNNNYPARHFFNNLWDSKIPEFNIIKNLIIPECPITKIIPFEESSYNKNIEVDFYIPQLKLVIEIDGFGHLENKTKDEERDRLFKNNQIEVIRITTNDINNNEDKINSIFEYIKNKINSSNLIKKYLSKCEGTINSDIILTSIYRLQVFLIELCKSNKNVFYNIEIKDEFNFNWCNIALEDFKDLFNDFNVALDNKYVLPVIIINKVNQFTKHSNIKIDFSVLKRWNDEIDNNIIKIRTDYFDFYNVPISRNKKLNFYESSSIDYAKFIYGNNIKYNINEEKLINLLNRLYNYDSFQKGQIPILKNILKGNDTIGILPTGGGKSLCFQLPSILQLGVTIIVSPITSLIRDQIAELQELGINRCQYISADNSIFQEDIYHKIIQGNIKYLIVSPERFQQSKFREDFLRILCNENKISYFVIDEVHCLSEWGHDFRVSYLTLAKTIKYYAPNIPVICLTATASLHVLENIKVEFNIDNENVKYLPDFTRNELDFEVITTNGTKNKLHNIQEILKRHSQEESGIVFCPFVNGDFGCYNLYQKIDHNSKGYFSGDAPKNISNTDNLLNKDTTQKLFKKNDIKLLFATKSFGMGVNKKNIRYTIHYGIPASIEGFYQEAGRAGRDKKNAICYVLFDKSKTNIIHDLSNVNVSNLIIKEKQQNLHKNDKGDIERQLYLSSNQIDEKESDNIIKTYLYCLNKSPNNIGLTEIKPKDLSLSDVIIEKALYRLYQLEIISNWTVTYLSQGRKFDVEFNNISIQNIRQNLINLIKRYKNEIFLQNNPNISYSLDLKFFIHILLKWNFETFDMNRRISLKNLNDLCSEFDYIGNKEFKKNLERYFKLNLKNNIYEEFIENDNMEEVLSLLYKDNNIISLDKIKEMHQQTNRYLESYYNNKSLNLLNIILNIILNNTKNKNISTFLNEIKYNKSKIFIISKIFPILRQYISNNTINKNTINEFVKDIFIFFNNDDIIYLQNEFNDDISKILYVNKINKRIKNILKETENGFK